MDQYTIHTIASVTFEIAHLTAGIALCVLGKSLLEKGVRGDFTGEGEAASQKFRLVTTSPGLVFLVAGLVVIVATVFTQSEFVQTSSENARLEKGEPMVTQTTSRMVDTKMPAADADAASSNVRIVRGLATVLMAAHPNPTESYGTAAAIVARIRQARNDEAEVRRKRVVAAIDELASAHRTLVAYLVADPEFDWILSDPAVVESLRAHLAAQLGQSMTPAKPNR
jgi:hypothetical protein